MKMIKKIHNILEDYVYDPSINIKERTFIMFSIAVLVALFAAIPCGIFMREPLSATLATLAGAVFFSLYVIWSFKKNRIERAKIVISIILVFLFLQEMFPMFRLMDTGRNQRKEYRLLTV